MFPDFKPFKTDLTLRSTYQYLVNNIPHVLHDNCPNYLSFQSLLPENFLPTINPSLSRLDTIYPVSIQLQIDQVNTASLLDIKNYDPQALLNYLHNTFHAEHDSQNTRNLISLFGTEAFGLYLPFHHYFNCGWGIYLFPEIISQNAYFLSDHFNSQGYTTNEILIMYFFAVYRHELYHYQTERFASKLELATNKAHYLALSDIDSQVRNTSDWLSEALAEATVLNSQLVTNRSKMSLRRMQKVYKFDLETMPPGYRDHACVDFGGPNNAQLYFASQINEMKLKPVSKLPDFFTIKNEFQSNDLDVPLYFVTGFNKIKRDR